MTSALFEVAKTGQTNNEWLLRLNRAITINSILGVQFFTPWNIDEELPEVEQEAILSISNELPGMVDLVKQQGKLSDNWLKKHKYRSKGN